MPAVESEGGAVGEAGGRREGGECAEAGVPPEAEVGGEGEAAAGEGEEEEEAEAEACSVACTLP